MEFKQRLSEVFGQVSGEMLRVHDTREDWISLTESQIVLLEDNGNSSENWSGVRVFGNAALDSVRNCVFRGDIRIAMTPAEIEGKQLAPVLTNCCLQNVTVLPGCRIESTYLLSNLHIGEGTIIENCGRLIYEQGSLCGCGTELELGVETGERNVPSSPCLDTDLAALLSGGSARSENLASYHTFLDGFLSQLRSKNSGVIGKACRIQDTPVLENCFIGSGVEILNACALRNSTVLGGEPNPASVLDGALVRDSILKWGSRVDSGAIVERSIVGEVSVVEKHGKLTSSFLGPNSVLAEGEITASLAGPFTSSHHQSLLIAARWPEGRGNIGYGANIGSNHTSRLPDQEIRPGEGMFFGLACSVKFPADYSQAPYSIIATGVTALPGRVEFPFSLICEPFSSIDGIPPAFNQIIPGWVLSDNLFAVERNEEKYSSRNRAIHWKPDGKIIREETIRMMMRSLEKLDVRSVKEIYTESDICGLGKNYLTEAHRNRAIETYRFHIRYFALECLSSSPEKLSVFQRDYLEREFPGVSGEELHRIVSDMREVIAESIRISREKDYSRGCRIITDYGDVR
jgi:NDP-sugar pyrophosphorylase family protein